MKNLIVTIILCMWYSVTVAAEPSTNNKPVVCDTTHKILSMLDNSAIDQTITWIGVGDEPYIYMLFTNTNAGTWTIIMTVTKELSCVLGTGTNSHGLPATTKKSNV